MNYLTISRGFPYSSVVTMTTSLNIFNPYSINWSNRLGSKLYNLVP